MCGSGEALTGKGRAGKRACDSVEEIENDVERGVGGNMIKEFTLTRVFDKFDVAFALNPDINILTGRNGCGKTTILKSMWYAQAGRIHQLLQEIDFEDLSLKTDDYELSISKGQETVHFRFQPVADDFELDQSFAYDLLYSGPGSPPKVRRQLDQLAKAQERLGSESLFFPTFRRMEGGFSAAVMGIDRGFVRRRFHQIEEVFGQFSEELSSPRHAFVTSISTRDIVDLFIRKYAEIVDQANQIQNELSEQIIKEIQEYGQPAHADPNEAANVLERIRLQVEKVEDEKKRLFTPLAELSALAEGVFTDKGITVTAQIGLGLTDQRVLSDKLSAGEKQMLSFLTYNAFYTGASFFIDEPELSLHVDWQRLLFPTLLRQSQGNQFIVSTHSPFIFSKYTDKEIVITPDRGGDLFDGHF